MVPYQNSKGICHSPRIEKHGKLSQNDVDEADTAVVWDKREIMIWIFGEIAKLWRFRQNFKSPNGACPRLQPGSPEFPLNGAIFLVTQFIQQRWELILGFYRIPACRSLTPYMGKMATTASLHFPIVVHCSLIFPYSGHSYCLQ